MGEISAGLVRKLEKAGLTEAETQVLALAVAGVPDAATDAEVEGFELSGLKMPGAPKLGNFEIQDLMSRFNRAEQNAGRHGVVINHEEQY